MSKFSRKFASTGKILKTRRMIPPRIEKPSYYLNGLVENQIDTIPKYKEALAIRSNNMREAAILAKTMRFLAKFLAKEGTTTEELDYKIHLDCIENGFYPAALHYKNFPKSISTSVNEIACHGIPDDRKLNNGDILKVDCMSYRNGHFGDCCGSFVIGEGGKDREEKENLVDVARKCVRKAIDVCGPGVPFSQVGNVISKIAEKAKLTIIKDYAGHGIGKNLHSHPQVLPFKNDFDYGVMEEGMTFTIEPILTTGDGRTTILKDGWSVSTIDGKPCAQFEDTVLITESGCDNLTEDLNSIDYE